MEHSIRFHFHSLGSARLFSASVYFLFNSDVCSKFNPFEFQTRMICLNIETTSMSAQIHTSNSLMPVSNETAKANEIKDPETKMVKYDAD